MRKGPKRWTPETLELFWRNGDPDFVGPVGPPMELWLMAGSPLDPWMRQDIRDPSDDCDDLSAPQVFVEQMAFAF